MMAIHEIQRDTLSPIESMSHLLKTSRKIAK